MTAPRVVFAGTPEFARVALAALLDAGVRPCAVLTQPERPAGRGRKLTPSPVKSLASARQLPVLEPRTLRDDAVVAELGALGADLVVVAAYGLLLPQAVLDLPRRGCVNVHASLLPRWRGAAPVQAAILAGDRDTGISLMHMQAGLDSGPVYAQAALAIGEQETAGELHDRLARLGGELLVARLPALLEGRLTAVPQDAAGVTYAGKISAADAVLNWGRPARQLACAVRAYNPVPGARFSLDGEAVKCWRALHVAGGGQPAGTVLAATDDGIDVACGEGVLRLVELQRAGRRRISAGEFARQAPLVGRRLATAAR